MAESAEFLLKPVHQAGYAFTMSTSLYANQAPEETSFSSLLEQLSGAVDLRSLNAKPVDVTKKVPPRSVSRADLFQDSFRPSAGAADRAAPHQPHAARAAKAKQTARGEVSAADAGLSMSDLTASSPDMAAVPALRRQEAAPAALASSAPHQVRSTVLSVRLNERELALLRDRAAESGISVSSYIRSCVVDADQLRIQVKQVLANLRSQSGLKARKTPYAFEAQEDEIRQSLMSRLAAGLRGLFSKPRNVWIAD